MLVPTLWRLGPEHRHAAMELFRAASSVGANVEEGQAGASRRDMAAKYGIALREARESLFWLRLLVRSRVLLPKTQPMAAEANELVSMLTTSVKKLRREGPKARES